MAIPVLVVTPNTSFGELIRQILEESGGYMVKMSYSAEGALVEGERGQPAVCILDADLDDMPLPQLCEGLRAQAPELRLIVIPTEEEGDEVALSELQADKTLSRPFYLPDLVAAVEEMTDQQKLESEELVEVEAAPLDGEPIEGAESEAASTWQMDVTWAARRLALLTLESSSQAALIIRGGEVWAYAGELPESAVIELAQTVASYWGDDGGDLARFVRLKAIDGEYMIYATGMGGDFVLTMAFEAEVPFSKIRTQVSDLAKALTSVPAEQLDDEPTMADLDEVEVRGEPSLEEEPSPTTSADWQLEREPLVGEMEGDPDAAKFAQDEEFLDELGDKEFETADEMMALVDDEAVAFEQAEAPGTVLAPELADKEFETADEMMALVDDEVVASEQVEDPGTVLAPELGEETVAVGEKGEDEEAEAREEFEWEVEAEVDVETPQAAEGEEAFLEEGAERWFGEGEAEGVYEEEEDVFEESFDVNEHAAETLPSRAEESELEIELEPVSPALYNLTYGCVLLPRLPAHYLTGTIASRLSNWVTQLCLAFGWRLEHLSIRPEYLQWMVNVPPTTSPGYLMRIMREHTSRRIFADFQNLEKENPSGDFWAPGYLIVSGTQPPPSKLIKDFIQQTRERQGVARQQ